jgi:hypothetical protein
LKQNTPSKILIICGSTEPGKDGVGDYTRILSNELYRLGMSVRLIALYDKYVSNVTVEPKLNGGNDFVAVRIPVKLSVNKKIDIFREELREFQPDFISIQFVPFSFNDKGIVAELVYLFSRIKRRPYKWSITFHELWINEQENTKIKMILWAKVQRFFIKAFVRLLNNPTLITTNESYASRFGSEHVNVLPLFGNIKIVSRSDNESKYRNNSTLRVLFFGSLTTNFEEFKQQLSLVKSIKDIFFSSVIFLFVGRQIGSIKTHEEIISSVLPDAVIEIKGQLPEEKLSIIIQDVDIAISRAGADLVNKSGSTIAILEHGIPVILRGIRNEVVLAENSWINLIYYPGDIIKLLPEKGIKKSVKYLVANKFINIIYRGQRSNG